MPHTVTWTRAGGSPVNIGHADQEGYVSPIDGDGFRRYRIRLIVLGDDRSDYESAIVALQTALRIRPLVVKSGTFRRKYIVPNGSQGTLTTAFWAVDEIYPETIEIEEGDPYGAYAVVTFVRGLY